jgi:CubicO group peptidase (beta-lactamase class C family)
MTSSQLDGSIPAIMPAIRDGKRVEIEPGGRAVLNGSLASPSSFGPAGYGGAYIWADPERELVGVYLSVSPRLNRDIGVMNSDLFQNAVYGAIVDQ